MNKIMQLAEKYANALVCERADDTGESSKRVIARVNAVMAARNALEAEVEKRTSPELAGYHRGLEAAARVCEEKEEWTISIQKGAQDDLGNVILRHWAAAYMSASNAIRALKGQE